MPTIKEILLREFECAIDAVYGTKADKEIDSELLNVVTLDDALTEEVDSADIDEIAKKVKFYLFD